MESNKRSKAITFTLVGHAHIDPVWLWDWREGYETVKATFRSALDRLKENPDMVFAHSSAAHYAWMQDHPAMLAEIKDAVARGQWEPVGGWWVEPDANVPSGEAHARQGLYGQRFFEKTIGRRAKVAFLPDTFGHPPTMPQLFKQAGLEYFVFMRPGKNEIDLPSNLFIWESPDGSRVLTARVETYNSNPMFVNSSLERNLDWRPEDATEWIGLYGVGNHGGGPTKKAIASIREVAASPDWPTVKMGTLEGFFSRASQRTDLPVVARELQHHTRGCYTAYSPIKHLNRKSENSLVTTEKFASIASFYGYSYPKDALTLAWKQLLFNQFHDILAGSSVEPAYEDAKADMGEVLSISGRTQFTAIQTIAQRIDTRRDDRPVEEAYRFPRWTWDNWTADLGDGVPVIFFNPNPWTRREVVDFEVNDWGAEEMLVMDEQNNPVLHQWAQVEPLAGGRRRVLFTAEVPPMGYRLYRLVDEPGMQVPENALPLTATQYSLENNWWKLEIDPVTGAIRSLFDKQRSLELLSGAGAQLLVMNDPSDTWGHTIESLRQTEGAFKPLRFELLEEGPVRATLRIVGTYEKSLARQEISLFRDVPNIEGKLIINWQEEFKAVKLAFPFAVNAPTATFSVPYGHAVRPAAGGEEPMQQWVDVTGQVADRRGVAQPYGVALLNDCKYAADVMGGEVRMTILRSPIFAHHDPAVPKPGVTYKFQDQGEQTIRWALVPHAGGWQDAGVVQAAHDLNAPMPFVREYAHPGELPNTQSFLTVNPPNSVVVSAVKQAEDGDDLVVRLYEPNGRAAQAHIDLPLAKASFDVNVGAHQIKTYRISRSGQVRETNFIED